MSTEQLERILAEGRASVYGFSSPKATKAETASQAECWSVPGARIGLGNDDDEGRRSRRKHRQAVQAMPVGGEAVAEPPDPLQRCGPRP